MAKKIVLVFVEGASDDSIFDVILDESCDLTGYKVEIMGGDPFSNYDNTGKGSKTIVKESIEKYLNKYKIKAKDLAYVAFITDSDGINIPKDVFTSGVVNNNKYVFDLSQKQIICTDDNKCESLFSSWEFKKNKLMPLMVDNLNVTINRKEIKYGLYFNSINLEHVTAGEILYSEEEKIRSADELVEKHENGEVNLINIFEGSKLSDDLKESWDILKESEWNKPYSNINILIEKAKKDFVDE